MMLPMMVKTFDFVKDFVHDCPYAESMTIGQRIQGTRLAKGITNASEFARLATAYVKRWGRSEVSRQYLNNLERDKAEKPDPVQLAAIAKAGGVDLHWLITGEGRPRPEHELDDDELALLTLYRRISAEDRLALIAQFINRKP